MVNRRFALTAPLVFFLSLAGVAQFMISQGLAQDCSGWLLLASVVGTFVCLMLGSRDRGYVAEHEGKRVYRPHLAVRLIAWAMLAAGAFLLFVSSRGLALRWAATYYRSFMLMAFGYALAGFGLDHIFGYTVRYRPMRLAQRRVEFLLLILVMATAVFMRTYRFNYYPPPDGFAAIEEVQQGDRASNMLRDGATPWEFLSSNFVTALSFKLFGMSTYSLRVPPVILSCLTVLVGYFLLKTLVGYRVALFASFLFACSRWHLTYSRISHNVFLPAVLVILCVYFLYRTTVSSRPSLYLWIGLTSGLLLYAYSPYRSTVLLVVVFFAERSIRWVISRMKSASGGRASAAGRGCTRHACGFLIVALSVLVLAIPLKGRLSGSEKFYFEAARRAIAKESTPSWYDTSDMGLFLKRRVERVRNASLIFTVKGDGAPTFNKPGEPMLDPFVGIIFILAVGFCTATLARERHTFMVICFYLTMGMGFLFPHNFDVRRMITVIPQVYALVALFTLALWRFSRRGRVGRYVILLFMVIISVCAFIHSFRTFFNQQVENPSVRKLFKNEYTVMATRVRLMPEGTFVIIVTPGIRNFFDLNDYKWYRGFTIRGAVVGDPRKALALARLARSNANLAVIVNHRYDIDAFCGRVREEFPVVREERFGEDMWGGSWTWAVLDIPAESEEEAAVVARVEGFSGVVGETPEAGYVVDSRGRVRSWRISGVGSEISWETSPAVEKRKTDFLFAGASGTGGVAAAAGLFVDGKPVMEFDLGYETSPKKWEASGYVLRALPVRTFRGKNVLYRLSVPVDSVGHGEKTEISVKIIKGNGDTWFAIHDRRDCWAFMDYAVLL